MADYYLISQLPSLDGNWENASLPITAERFEELCSRFLGQKALKKLAQLKTVPDLDAEKTGSSLLDGWTDAERDLRLALAAVRAEKLGKPFEPQRRTLSAELLKTVATAVELEDPLEAEYFLLRCRLGLLEQLRPMDSFSEDYVFYYGLKLKLILRLKQFDRKAGEAAYKEIYTSVLNGDRLEA